MNVFSLRPGKLARSCVITAHVKFIKTQIPNISSFFCFKVWKLFTLGQFTVSSQRPVNSTTSLSSNIMHSLIGIYHTTKWSSRLLRSSSLQRIHGSWKIFGPIYFDWCGSLSKERENINRLLYAL